MGTMTIGQNNTEIIEVDEILYEVFYHKGSNARLKKSDSPSEPAGYYIDKIQDWHTGEMLRNEEILNQVIHKIEAHLGGEFEY